MRLLKKKKFLFISNARSDFGLIFNLYSKFKLSAKYESFMVCFGSTISKNYGYNKKDIKLIDNKIKFFEYKFSDSSEKKIYENIKNSSLKLINYCKKIKPSLVFVLGDRIETLEISIVVKMMNLNLAHLHGGESTEGIYDDFWRHATSKLSNLHFVSNENYKKNLIQMGENKKHIHVVGAFGIENILKTTKELYDRLYFEKYFAFRFNKINFVLVFHSLTLDSNNNLKVFNNIIKALLKIKNSNIFISSPGYDVGSNEIIKFINKTISAYKERIYHFSNLGNKRFLSLVNCCEMVVGNSSSGIIEVPYLNKPVLNIGSRQKGRIKPNLVFESSETTKDIHLSILKIIKLIKNNNLPKNNKVYGYGHASEKTLNIIDQIDLDKLDKKFF